MGGWSGMTVKSVLDLGRKYIFDILKYYDLSDDILDQYHIHPHNRKENTNIGTTCETTCEEEYSCVNVEEDVLEKELEEDYPDEYEYYMKTGNYNRLYYGNEWEDPCECNLELWK